MKGITTRYYAFVYDTFFCMMLLALLCAQMCEKVYLLRSCVQSYMQKDASFFRACLKLRYFRSCYRVSFDRNLRSTLPHRAFLGYLGNAKQSNCALCHVALKHLLGHNHIDAKCK